MRRHSPLTDRPYESPLRTHPEPGAGLGAAAISTRHQLLSSAWTTDVQVLERAIAGIKTDATPANSCEVVFFEIAGDEHLHVNVTHKYATKTARGWAGPGSMPNGFIHNRRFGDMSQNDMIRHIRDMVVAARV